MRVESLERGLRVNYEMFHSQMVQPLILMFDMPVMEIILPNEIGKQ